MSASDFTMARSKTAEAFYCDRCMTPKKAKAKATRRNGDGTTTTICNGCYGNIVAGGDERV